MERGVKAMAMSEDMNRCVETCLSCYKTACDFVPNCMDLISVSMVSDAVIRQLEKAREPHPAASGTARGKIV